MKIEKLLLAGMIGLLVNIAFAQQVDSPKPQKLRVSEGVMIGNLIGGVLPEYPEALKAKRISGSVVLGLQIDKAGHVAQVIALNGPPMLAEPAINAVKQWQFRPYFLNGEPVELETTATFYFSPDQAIKLRLSQSVAEANLIHKVEPLYSQTAKIAHIEGDVVLGAVIDKQGDVKDLRAISGHPTLVQAALEAVRQWKYKPYLLNGEPVEVETQVVVKFNLGPEASTSSPSPAPDESAKKSLNLRVSQGVAESNIIRKVDPEYPQEAKSKRLQGNVVLQATIDRNGYITNLKPSRGHPLLFEAAVEAVKQWRYKPYLLNGEPVEVDTVITVKFQLQ